MRSMQLVKDYAIQSRLNAHHGVQVAAKATTIVPLDASVQALELALGALSERLAMTCASPSLLDPPGVAATAEAIGKVAHALGQVKQLQHQCSSTGAP